MTRFPNVDTLNNPVLVNGSTNSTYQFSHTGIAWPGEKRKYAAQTQYKLSDIVPPPNWRDRYPDGYTSANPPPNLNADEHFQNWMRTAGLPTFSKLYGRNDDAPMLKGTYELDVYMSTSPFPCFLSCLPVHRIVGVNPTLTCSSRLPRLAIRWHQIRRHLHCIVDRREESIPWICVRRRCRTLRATRHDWIGMALLEAPKTGRYESAFMESTW